MTAPSTMRVRDRQWEFRVDPCLSRDRRRKHYVMLRFLARNKGNGPSYRCGIMLTNKLAVKKWADGLRGFADLMDKGIAQLEAATKGGQK